MGSDEKTFFDIFGNISPNFKVKTISDIASKEKRSIISGPFGSNISSKYFKDYGIPVIRGNNVTEDLTKFIDNGFVFISKEKADELNTYAVENDLIFTAAGTIGQVGIIPKDTSFNEYIISNKQLRVRLDLDRINPLYAYYWFSSPPINKYIKLLNTGSTIPLINLSILKNLPIPLPNKDIQDKIANIISFFDNKIEINKKINQNLESQINLLFKSFFIKFDYFDDLTFKDTIFGEIPNDWAIISMSNILKERNEQTTNQRISMYSVTTGGIKPRDNIYNKKITAKTTKFKIVLKNDLVFGMPNSGYQFGLMYDEIGGVSSAYPVFEVQNIYPRYIEFFINNISNYFNDIVKSGSRMGQGIDKKVLLSKDIYIPPHQILELYCSLEKDLLDLINHYSKEINILYGLRDTLLPKLMNGEIDVSNIRL